MCIILSRPKGNVIERLEKMGDIIYLYGGEVWGVKIQPGQMAKRNREILAFTIYLTKIVCAFWQLFWQLFLQKKYF